MAREEVVEGRVLLELDEVPVVEAGAANGALVGAEAEAPDQVERALRRRGEAADVAGVLRDLRLHQDDPEGRIDPRGAEPGSVSLATALYPAPSLGEQAR